MRTLLALSAILLVAAEPPADAVKKDMSALEGEWTMTSGEREGEAFPDEYVKSGKREVKDGVSTVTIGDSILIKSNFTVDPTKKPKAIDFEVIDGQGKGTKLHGIYEIDGDTMKICLTVADKDRPTDFTTKADGGRTLTVWKRVKK
jgi:uncharacterized protein (TIGR03067 family)